MSDYTPTTEEVRNSYASWSDAYPEFDRWLAEHDRLVIWNYLREKLRITTEGEEL